MKKRLLFSALTIVLSLTIFNASAQTPTPVVTDRQINQHQRINEGVNSGDLTRREARRLKARQAKVQHDKKIAKADGVVTKAERRKLRREQNRNSRAIRRQKNDAQQR